VTSRSQIATVEPAAVARDSRRQVSIVHLVLSLNIGGLEKVVYDLVRCADRARFSMQVLCLDRIGDLGPAFARIGVPVEPLDLHARGTMRGVFTLAERLRKLRPDVLHTHNAAPHLVGAPAAKLSRVPAVIHTRHGAHLYSGIKSRLANRFSTSLTGRMVAVSGATAAMARRHDRVSARRLDIIHNGVDLELYRQKRSPEPHRCLRAIHAARLADPIKDQRTLLRAARLVVDQVPDFHLDIVGDGPDRRMLEELCDALRLRDNITFLGLRHDLHELLPRADLFVLSSLTEGLPMTVLEAMAAGLPVVATNVGGIAELVTTPATGTLVPPAQPPALAAAILELVRNPGRAAAMGAAGRQRVEDEFDVRVVTARYEALYRAVLREVRP
jgi:glycosyltransferase involved in cell wall biosynthesis